MSKFRSSFALARSPPPKYLLFQVTVFCCCLFVFVCFLFWVVFCFGRGCLFVCLFVVLSSFPRRFVDAAAAAAAAVFVTFHLLFIVS